MLRPLAFLCPLALLAQEPVAPATTAGPTPSPPSAEQVISLPEPGRFKKLFQPFRTDSAALSPDGKYLAYSVREGETLSVLVVAIDAPGVVKAKVKVVDDEAATPMMSDLQRERTPGRINWMRWATPTRLVVETNQIFALRTQDGENTQWQSWQGTVIAFDADGGNARELAGPDDVFENLPTGDDAKAFSTKRSDVPRFNSRVRLPEDSLDVKTAEAEAGNGFAPLSGSLTGVAPAPETAFPAGMGQSSSTSTPRNLRVFDLDPVRPGAVTLVASGAPRDSGNRQLGFFSLDATTGKLTNLADDFLLSQRVPRIDRQGNIRLTVANSLLSGFPLAYTYLGTKGQNRPRPLAEVTGLDGFMVSPGNYFGTRAIPLGFDENPNLLYYASNVGRDTYGIYSVDLVTGKRGALAMENPGYDLISPPGAGFSDLNTLVFDRFTHQLAGVRYENAFRTTAWVRPDLRSLQAELERLLPRRVVEIIDWDQAGRRVLLSTEGPADPGAFYIFDREKNQLLEFARRAPWIDVQQTHATLPFSYARPDGARISGLVTVPQQPRLKPVPMVVLLPDVPWQRVRSDFQTEVQALADMGFAVVQLNGRGAWGLGLKQRSALTAGYDLVQVDDVVTTITNLEKIFAVNLKRVALIGRGHGGFIALRALQEHPDKFRCAIALDSPVNLADWLAEQRWSGDDVLPHLTRGWLGDAARLKAAPLTRAPGTLTKPLLLLNYPGPYGAPPRNAYVSARGFAASIRREGGAAEFDALHLDYMRGLPAARAEVFDRIENFLNANIYDFKVKLREFEVIK